MKALADRKMFIHDLGHATVAYAGYYHHPHLTYIYEVLSLCDMREFVQNTMRQSAEILLLLYPEEFTREQLYDHIDDLINRFQNKAMGDTLFRVGHDLKRKLGKEGCLMTPLRTGLNHGCEVGNIAEVICYALFFRATDENKQRFPVDIQFYRQLEEKGASDLFSSVSELDENEKNLLINKLADLSIPIKYY